METIGYDDIPIRKSSLTNPISIGLFNRKNHNHLHNSSDTLYSLSSFKDKEHFSYHNNKYPKEKMSSDSASKSKPISSSSYKGSSLASKTSGSSLREKKVLNVSNSSNTNTTTTTTTTNRIPNSSSSSKISALNSPKSHIYKNFTDSSGKSKINNMMKLDSSEERINRAYVSHSGHQSPLMSRKNNNSNSSISNNKNIINKVKNEHYARQINTSSPPVPDRTTSFKNVASTPTTTYNKNTNKNHKINVNDDEDGYEDYDDYDDDDDDSNDNTFMNSLMNKSVTSFSSTDNNIISAFNMNNLKEEVSKIGLENTDSSTTVENSVKSTSKKSLKEKLLAKKMKRALKKEEANVCIHISNIIYI